MVSARLLSTLVLFSAACSAQQQNGGNGGGNNQNGNGGGGNNGQNGNNNGQNGNNNANQAQNGGADGTQLLPNAVQTGSFFDGQQALGADADQVAAATSKNNFINFCAGKTLTNGLQITDGSCNGIVMGDIPAKNKMISTIITFPQAGQTIESGKDFNITVQVNGLQAGAFTNAVATYYSSPQTLNGQGNVIGHTHVTVQDLGQSLNPGQPPDPTQFAFFKGINDAGNGNGLLQAVVTGGLPPGQFRVCTLTSASNHQPVIMPVAQRGSQDDCTKFTVNGNDNDINDAANNGAKGQDAAAQAQQAVDLGPGAIDPNAGKDGENDQNGQQQGNDNQNQQGNQQNNQNGQQQGGGGGGGQSQQNQGDKGADQSKGGQSQAQQTQSQSGQSQGAQSQGAQSKGQQNQSQGAQSGQGGAQSQGQQKDQNQSQQNGQQSQADGKQGQSQGAQQKEQGQNEGNKNARLARLARRSFIA